MWHVESNQKNMHEQKHIETPTHANVCQIVYHVEIVNKFLFVSEFYFSHWIYLFFSFTEWKQVNKQWQNIV